MTASTTLPAIVVQIEGSVRTSTVDDFRNAAMEYVGSIRTDLTTDHDFAEAEGMAKWCKKAEKEIKAAKEQAMAQAADINAVFETLDEVADAIRKKRLDLERQVKAQKATLKQAAIDSAMAELGRYVADMETRLDGLRLPPVQERRRDIQAAGKNKRTLRTLNKSIDAALSSIKSDYQAAYQVMSANAATLRTHHEYSFLFSDAQNHADKAPDEFENLVDVRIAQHKESEAARLEAEREKIRAEEHAKAETQASTTPPPEHPDLDSPAAAATFEEQMQTIMSSFTALIEHMGQDEFLQNCGLTTSDYERIKQTWRDRLGVTL